MIIKSAEINKFKSINTENNMVFFDKTVTALIGKNESGKSNILESIGLIKNLFLPLGTEYLNNKTRGQSDNPSIILTLSFTTFDKEKFP
ncbi:MAG: AAA family ATPase, partial [Clostridia bacterium]|nr:AAA family ATPase [Clostridia bacterium]